MAHNSAPSSPEDVSDVRPVVDARPEILVLSSAIRDGLNHAMQPVNSTLESLTKTVVALQRKLLPPSHYGLRSGAIDVATPPSAFRQLGCQSSSLSRAHHLHLRSLRYTQLLHPMLLLGLELHHHLHHPAQGTEE